MDLVLFNIYFNILDDIKYPRIDMITLITIADARLPSICTQEDRIKIQAYSDKMEKQSGNN